MNDLRIHIAYMTTAELRRIGESLKADPADLQPGWFVRVYKGAGNHDIVKYARLTPLAAQAVAQKIAADGGRRPAAEPAVTRAQAENARQRHNRRKIAEDAIAV